MKTVAILVGIPFSINMKNSYLRQPQIANGKLTLPYILVFKNIRVECRACNL
jgi:hypothetical protein